MSNNSPLDGNSNWRVRTYLSSWERPLHNHHRNATENAYWRGSMRFRFQQFVLLLLGTGLSAHATMTTSTASSQPAAVAPGTTVTFSSTIMSDTAMSGVNIALEVRDPSNHQ